MIRSAGLTELQRRQLVLADNRIALNAGWDLEMLHLELKDLSALGADLSALGFTAQELAGALHAGGLGRAHRRERDPGSCRERRSRLPATSGALDRTASPAATAPTPRPSRRCWTRVTPQLMVTDPPYGVDYDPAWRHRAGVNNRPEPARSSNDERADWAAAWALFPGNRLCLARRAHARPSPRAWSGRASPSGRRSSGRRSAW